MQNLIDFSGGKELEGVEKDSEAETSSWYLIRSKMI